MSTTTTTTKAFRGAADLTRWNAEARQRGRRPNVAYFGARYRSAYFDRLMQIGASDLLMPGNRRKRLLRKMRRSARTWRRLIRMGTALGHPIALSMNPLLHQLAEIEERRIARLVVGQHQRVLGLSLGYSVLEAHEETVNGLLVHIIDRIGSQSISPISPKFFNK